MPRRLNRTLRLLGLLALAVAILLVFLPPASPSSQPTEPAERLVARFLDVGQADAIFITLPNQETLLIDAGSRSSGVFDMLKDMGLERLDYVVFTHPHEDHIGGAAGVVEGFQIGEIWMPRATHTSKSYEDLLLAIQAKNLRISECKAGAVMIDEDGIRAVFLGPAKTFDDLNNMSAVLCLTYGDTNLLFTGDAEGESEAAMLEAGLVPQADLLKVGHHGSSTSTSQAFLDRVKPKIAVVSVGSGNDYGHPHESTLGRLNRAGAAVYRTDLNGTITVETDGKMMEVRVEKGQGG